MRTQHLACSGIASWSERSRDQLPACTAARRGAPGLVDLWQGLTFCLGILTFACRSCQRCEAVSSL